MILTLVKYQKGDIMAINRRQAIANVLSQLNPLDKVNRQQFMQAAQKEYGLGRDDYGKAYRTERTKRGLSEEAPRGEQIFATYPTSIRIRENLGIANPAGTEARNEMQMGLESTPAGRAGQFAGTLAADLTQDRGRSIYWLLNAIQAAGEVVTESTLGKVAPHLFETRPIINKATGAPIQRRDKQAAIAAGLIDPQTNTLRHGITLAGEGKTAEYREKKVPSGVLASLAIPTGIAINSGIGLMTPFGGQEGYEAVIQDPDDPSKSANAVLEVGAKYIAGRTGNLLPYDEFRQVRPDVSPEEYGAYKAFKYDKPVLDLDMSDGDVGIGGGFLKATTDGIHGPEIQMLGRSLPVTTGVIPFLGALGGTLAGARYGKRPARDAFIAGMGGLGVSTVAGNIIEQERRNRNARANAPVTAAIDPEGPYSTY